MCLALSELGWAEAEKPVETPGPSAGSCRAETGDLGFVYVGLSRGGPVKDGECELETRNGELHYHGRWGLLAGTHFERDQTTDTQFAPQTALFIRPKETSHIQYRSYPMLARVTVHAKLQPARVKPAARHPSPV